MTHYYLLLLLLPIYYLYIVLFLDSDLNCTVYSLVAKFICTKMRGFDWFK